MVQLLFDLLFEEHRKLRLLHHLLLPLGSLEILAYLQNILKELLTELTSDIVLDELRQEMDAIVDIEREFQVTNAFA